jgi:adenine-specific DNA-methyltransferase
LPTVARAAQPRPGPARSKYPADDIEAEQPLTVPAPPLYIQEKVHSQVLIDDLKRQSEKARSRAGNSDVQIDMFAGFNGLPSTETRTEFYQRDAHWSNRVILGDSLQVMASLTQRGKVQSI